VFTRAGIWVFFYSESWHGTLLEDKADRSATIYRRNRSYDPQSGRFTQEDPIGLAGGINLYGFAAGDPVNFSDPFGLCPEYLTGRPCSTATAILAGFVPGPLDVVEIVGAARGKDVLTGEEISGSDKVVTALGAVAGSGKLARHASHWLRGKWGRFREAVTGSRGSTGRTVPGSLTEQFAMQQARSDPLAGDPVALTMGDPRWPAAEGWVKMRQSIKGVEIHYVRNIHSGRTDDFKFVSPEPRE
jgi:RHS repeat-associated protein